jgi:hypothetical protein
MRILTNEALYKRNTRLAFVANLAGVVFLAWSVFILFNAGQFGLYLLLLILGFISVQIGSYFGRWNRRPDHALNQALKSLDDSYTLYHFRSPVSHLLLGPTGLWILMPRNTRGTISYDSARRRWVIKGAGLLARFSHEAIGKPIVEASLEAEALDRFLQKAWKGGNLRVQAAVAFIDPDAEVQAGNAPIPAASSKKLKQIMLKADEKSRLTPEQNKQLRALFEKRPAK